MTTWRLIRSSVAALAVAVAGAGLAAPAGATPADAVVAPAAESDDERPSYLGKSYYTGEFHSHTSVSDGAELPPDAFEHVQSETDADFFTVSEHDVMWDIRNGDDFIDDWRDADSDEWRWLHEQADSFNASQQDLVVVPSIENTWYDGTGHINVFNADWHATARATEQGSNDGFANSFGTGDMKYDMYTFFARLKLDPESIGQFNHPSAGGKGNFFGFNGLDPVADDRMDLIEVKVEGHFAEYQRALDAGWHLGPVWNGDEHQANWVSGNESITGVWASEHSLDGLYDAMNDRSVFTSQDVNTVLRFGADGHLMGSILPADTTSLSFDIGLSDPDDADEFTAVRVYTNDGEVAHEFSDVSGSEVQLELDHDVTAGDYYYVRAEQADGQFIVSAPIWIGETTRGANYAPEISVEDDVPAQASYGQSIDLPAVTATDDSGEEPTLTYEVYDAAGEIQARDGEFTVRSYDDHFIVVKAEDGTGNINAELIRITVDRSRPDPAGVFQHFGSTAAVAEQPGGAGIAVSTDRSIEQVYAQVRPAGEEDWSTATVLTSTNDRPYEVNTIGNDEPVYQHSITGQTLRSHEFDVTGLDDGRRYEYRLGVAVDDAAPDPSDTSAWTGVQEEFVAGGAGNEPVYVLGDLQAQSHDPADLGLLRQVLDRLRSERPGGTAAVQLGDLVDNGGRGQYWQEVYDHVFDGLDLQIAPVAGNHETYGDLDYNALSEERTAIFSNMYDLPDNGAIGESNYSFDRGDVHFSVLNSNVDFDEQLDWLIDDVRASTATWHVVMGHFSYYGGSHAADPGMAVNRDKITGVLDQLGVDLYLGAHDHTYKRSTIYDGRLAQTPAEEAAGTTFVTMGSSGPKFYENVPYWWDDVVFDEDVQMGGVVEVTDAGLELSVHTVDGRTVDTYTVKKPRGIWKLSSAAVEDRELPGVGLLSYPGSRDTVTVTAATYDNAQQQVIEMRSMEVRLDHTGVEQYVAFDEPLPVRPSDTLKVFVWDRLENGKPLRPALVREGIAGEGTPEDPYLIDSADDLVKIDNDPDGHYRLTADLDLSDHERPQIGRAATFTGVFDGGGHTISGFTAFPEHGVGIFAENHGTIRNLVVDGNAVAADKDTAGLLVDINYGTVEQVRVQGSITAENRVGGVAGDHYGVIRDSYSTADVHATDRYSGGVVGIAIGGSVTENVYAEGRVTADGRNAGGVVSYGYNETVVRHVVSLNRAVSAPSYGHAIVGRVANGQVAVLEDNHTSASVPVSGQSLTDPPAADNWHGAIVPVGEVRTQAFFEQRGWDFGAAWEWSESGRRPVLQVAPEDVEPIPTPTLPTDDRGFYIVDSVDDLAQVGEYPAYDYVLAADLDLSGAPFTSLEGPFVGEFDGAGHTVTGYTSSSGGLFAAVRGSVHDVTLADATVDTTASNVGLLVDRNDGVIERVATSGSISGGATVGAVTGYSCATIRDSYSTADVTATSGRQAGGIVGIAGGAAQCSATGGSLTERTYAAGRVEVVGNQNAGGISGYTYTGTTIRDSIALNPAVVATGYAHRIAARTLSGNTATLAGNYASEAVDAAVQAIDETGPGTLNGETVTAAAAAAQATYVDLLGWDFGGVWQWDDARGAPVLRSPSAGAEQVSSASRPGGSGHSTRVMPAVAVEPAVAVDGGIGHDAIRNDDGTVTVTVHAGDEAAGQQAGVVILPVDGDLAQPSAEDVAYLNEVTLDAAGDGAFTFVLPEGETADFAIAVNTSGESERYLAVLDPGGSLPWQGSVELTARVRPEQPKAGRNPVTARVEVTNADGVPVSGTVTVDAEGIEPTTATIVKGRVRLRLPVFDTAGSHELTISYNGSGELSPATITQTIEVRP